MLESARKSIALSVPRMPAQAVLAAAAVGSFVWLLSNDLIHPIVIYLLQLYLAL